MHVQGADQPARFASDQQDLHLGRHFHQFDAVIGAILAIGIIWFIWSHWQNRIQAQN